MGRTRGGDEEWCRDVIGLYFNRLVQKLKPTKETEREAQIINTDKWGWYFNEVAICGCVNLCTY